jgi:uncharacterized protein YjeT (DUF2065 family)
MVLKLSLNAQKSLDDYINQVKAYLKGVKSVDAEEIVQNINEHIENELTGAAEPVGSETLDKVLKKLGNPQQWVPEEELSWWKKFVLRIRTGPEDWRLAYISFGLFLFAFLFNSSFFVCVILVTASYIVSRAAMSLSDYNVQVKAQKWLLYPPMIIVTLFLAGVLLLLPLSVLIPIAENLESSMMQTYKISIDDNYWYIASSFIAMLICLWWILEGIVCLIYPLLPRRIFYPMAEWFKRKHALVLIALAVISFAVSFTSWMYAINTYIN